MDKFNQILEWGRSIYNILETGISDDIKLFIGLLLIWLIYKLLKTFTKLGDSILKFVMPVSVILSIFKILGFQLPDQVNQYLDLISKLVFFL